MTLPPSKDTPPVLAIFLLLAGLIVGALACWIGSVDLAVIVESHITSARGAISPETSAWLRSGILARASFGIAGGLIILGVTTLRFRSRLWQYLTQSETNQPPGATLKAPWGIWAVVCLAVFVYYFPTLGSGYFRYDDFDLLASANDRPFWATLWQPNGDHFLPLTRLLAWLGLSLSGTGTWLYNFWILLCLSGVLVTGTGLLHDLKISRPAQLVFAALVIFWSPWAEIMSGYYILSTYLLIATLGLAAIRFYLRWLETRRHREAAGAGVCLLLSALVDISGCHAIGACGVFLGLNFATSGRRIGFRSWLTRHASFLGWTASGTGIALACIFYDYRVLHPGIFLGMAGEGTRSLAQLAADLSYQFLAGMVLSMVTPFVYARLPLALLLGLVTTVSLLWLGFSAAAVRASDPPRRWIMAAIFLVIMGACLMVGLGRHSADTVVVRWAAKHICSGYLWLCLLFATSWDALWLRVRRRLFFAELTLISLIGFVTAQTTFGLLGMAVAFPPFGYPAELRDAGRRKHAVEFLRTHLVGKMAAASTGVVVVPTLDGRYIKAVFPSLFDYNLSRYRPFYEDLATNLRFVRGPGMQPWPNDSVQSVSELRPAISPLFLTAVANDPELRALYLGEVPLEGQSLPGPVVSEKMPGPGFPKDPTTPETDTGVQIESDGHTGIVIRESDWNPNTAPHLRLNLQLLSPQSSKEFSITVSFWNELMKDDWRGTISSQDLGQYGVDLDLRQAYAFSLSTHVRHLRIILTQPGIYRVRLAEITP